MRRNSFRSRWGFDPEIDFLNHGSFGACPMDVLAFQQALRHEMEREPIVFLWRCHEGLLEEARLRLGKFLRCRPRDIAFVPNATTGVNTVLASFPLQPGDEILVTDHGYKACNNAAERWAGERGAKVVTARVPFPIEGPGEVLEALLSKVSRKTRLAVVDHVSSPTALVFPIRKIVGELSRRGVETLVDGAHGPGMLPLDLKSIGAAFYTGNLHKWVCAPKGAGFLHIREDWQARIQPLVTSHGLSSTRTDRSRFLLQFDWTGTDDPTPFLSVPSALAFLEGLFPGGFAGLYKANRALAIEARELLCRQLGIAPPCPRSMLGSMAAIPLPDGPVTETPVAPLFLDRLHERLFSKCRIEVPVSNWPAYPRRVLRISAQAYNDISQFDRLGNAISFELGL